MLTLEPKRRQGIKLRVPKSIVRTLMSVVVLLVLMVGAGVGYVWYMGQHPPHVQADETSVAKPSPNAKESAAVQSLTSPVAPGDNASVAVRTLPDSACTITVVYDKTASKDSGLGQKTADEYGLVSWTWTVEAAVPLGKWPVTVTCAYNNKTAVVQGDLVVAKPAN
jgi:hypothetical protein